MARQETVSDYLILPQRLTDQYGRQVVLDLRPRITLCTRRVHDIALRAGYDRRVSGSFDWWRSIKVSTFERLLILLLNPSRCILLLKDLDTALTPPKPPPEKDDESEEEDKKNGDPNNNSNNGSNSNSPNPPELYFDPYGGSSG